MNRKGRKRKIIQWEEIMVRKAWLANELARKIGLSMRACRRYLIVSTGSGRLLRKPFGRYMYYAVACFCREPNVFYNCPKCGKKMDEYRRKCGCVFKLCSVNEEHNEYSYCELHGHADKERAKEVRT